MALKRFIGPEAVMLRLMGEDYGLVEPGQSVPVPDGLAEQLAWPADLWEDGTVPQKEAK